MLIAYLMLQGLIVKRSANKHIVGIPSAMAPSNLVAQSFSPDIGVMGKVQHEVFHALRERASTTIQAITPSRAAYRSSDGSGGAQEVQAPVQSTDGAVRGKAEHLDGYHAGVHEQQVKAVTMAAVVTVAVTVEREGTVHRSRSF